MNYDFVFADAMIVTSNLPDCYFWKLISFIRRIKSAKQCHHLGENWFITYNHNEVEDYIKLNKPNITQYNTSIIQGYSLFECRDISDTIEMKLRWVNA